MNSCRSMINRASIALMCVFASLFAGAATWFDAEVPDYLDWPADGSNKTVDSVGVWTNTTNTSYADNRITTWKELDDCLEFNLDSNLRKEVSGEVSSVVASIRFIASPIVGEPLQDSKGAICAKIADDGSVTNYMGLVKDPVGGTNVWATLSGAVPDETRDCAVKISSRVEAGVVQVRYEVDGALLTSGGNEWFDVAATDATLSGVGFAGSGEVANLVGLTQDVEGDVELTIPAVANISVVSVKVGGEEIQPTDGKYIVPIGSNVIVTFATAAGHALSGSAERSYFLTGDTTLAYADMPQAVDVGAVIKINEVMASNGDTLATKNGGAELDWVELRNNGDVDADLTGWYINDSDEKAPKVRIEGSCVVPARGFKIVWCDKSYTNWATDEAHAKLGIGKSGGTVILADAASMDAIRVRLTVPPQMKDISYGLGSRENMVLSTLDPAQYRVGSGAWRNVAGPVGMPGATNLFRVISYKLDSSTATTIPAVEAAIASGTYAPVRTNFVDTIAYSNANSSVQTSPEFAPYYKHVGTLGPGVITGSYYAFLCEGVVYIPTATNWTFSVGSDDGFSLKLYNEKYSFESEFPGGRSYGQTPAIFRIQEPGAYNVKLVYFQGTGSASLDFSVKEGEFEDYENFTLDGFRLVGLPESGITHAGAWAGHALNDVSGEMLGVSDTLEWKATFTLEEALAFDDACKFKVRYADGFTARVNGTVVTNALAAGQRTLADALVPAIVDVPKSLLVVGDNTVEITAVNDAVNSAEFLLSAEVVITKADGDQVYFRVPTPGAANTTAGYGPATPKVAFSVPHGYKTEAFSLELSCAEAPGERIYYTLDGTSPTTSSTLYTGPIAISSTTCVRAAIPQDGAVIQQDSSATYLFLADILGQTRGVVPAGFPANKAINNQAMLYGMDQNVVNGSDRDRLLRGFTNSVATMSIVIDPHNLFDSVEGIYVNAKACDGRAWERLTMVEQIDPKDAANGFSTAAGIRIRGAFSRDPKYPKHSLRLFFRNDYGDGPLEFPLFGDEGASKFKKVDLRTSQNYSWANGDSGDTFVHEVFSRDSQRDMGDLYTRSRFYNLFINGQYWGLYQTQERGDEDFAETYNGGDADLYDVIKTSQPGYVTGASEGTVDAWYALWDMAVNQGFSGAYVDNYRKAMGQNPDGSRNPEYPVYLNPTNLMDYVINAHYVVDSDSPASTGSNKANNLYAVRDRDDNDDGLKSQGFYYLRHDAEHSMGVNTDRSKYSDDPTPYGTELRSATFKNREAFNPSELHYKLCYNPEYKMAFADRFYKHCLAKGGALTAEKSRERFQNRMAEIDDVIVCEAARWATKGQTRQTWLNACNGRLDFIDNRTAYMLQQYRARGWYPSVAAPAAYDADGVRIAPGTQLPDGATVKLMSSESNAAYANGTVYYTLDGTDPRAADGSVAASAIVCPAAGFALPQGGATVNARYLSTGGEWSALDVAALAAETLSDQVQGIRVAAVYSNTLDGGGDGSEFIILTNLLDHSVSLEGLRFTCAKTGDAPKVDVTLGAGLEIAAGGTMKLTKADNWPSAKITNGAVDMLMYDSEGATIQTLHFEASWWSNACKGTGAYFIALEFGDTLTTDSQWTYPSDQVIGVRVAAVYSSTADGGGDGSEFIVLTNLLNRTVSLEGLRFTCTKTGDATPKVDVTVGAGREIAVGGTVTFTKADDWSVSGAKITNGAVDMMVYDSDGAVVQTLHIDAGWFPVGYSNKGKPIGACDGTGAHFIALDFGETVTTEAQWKPSFIPPASTSAGYEVVKAAAADNRIRLWLDGLAATAQGMESVTNFAGTAAALAECYLVNVPLETEPEIELEIPSISFDANGHVVIGGKLTLHDVESGGRTINGVFKLYHAATLEELNGAGATIKSLGSDYPIPEEDRKVDKFGDSRFYQLKIE